MADEVELSLPVEAGLVVLARLTAATVASRAGFDVEEIEDLRLAVDELCLAAIRGRADGRIDLRFNHDRGWVEVSCRHRAVRIAEVGADGYYGTGLSTLILDVLVDEHGVHQSGGLRDAWLRKRRTIRLD